MAETRNESLSAYVRRTRGDCEGHGPDWLADEIEVLELALGFARFRAGDTDVDAKDSMDRIRGLLEARNG